VLLGLNGERPIARQKLIEKIRRARRRRSF
jgi:hypothetical protein